VDEYKAVAADRSLAPSADGGRSMQMLDRIRWCCTGHNPAAQNPAQYWQVISAEMNMLYVLSFLLTAHKEEAENCLEKALDRFIEGSEDFVEWARTRGRDAVLEHAFLAAKPEPDAARDYMDFSNSLASSAGHHLFGAIAGLPAFERFVFVMSTIYGKPDSECARFLGSSRCKVTIARELTEHLLLANIDDGPPPYSMPSAPLDGAYLFNPHSSLC